MKPQKFIIYFGMFGAALAAFSYFRMASGVLASEMLDAAIWFLAGPVALLQMYFALPEFLSLFLTVIYYTFLGVVFARVSKLPNRLLISTLVIFALVILHAATGMKAGKILGALFKDILNALLQGK